MVDGKKEVLPGNPADGKFGGQSKYTLIVDSPQQGVETNYFSILKLLEGQKPFGSSYSGDYGRVEKIKDVYTAGESSAYWGMTEQRKSAQQDKFQQIMANVGQMVKSLFQLLRELRIMDERLEYYTKSYEGDKAAEVALKSIWVDMVEGGAKNPGSVIGLATQVGFVTLPDLFFSVHPKKSEGVEKEVDKLKKGGFNRKVREVLMRKLKQYLVWKEKTYDELQKGQQFKLKYMRQHYHVIKIYLNWLRPYLRNIKRLQMKSTEGDKDIMAAFDTSKVELEILAIKQKADFEISPGNKEEKTFQHFFPCIRVRITFVSMPQMAYQQEGFQRGAIHVGKTTIVIEGFVVTEESLVEYKKSIEDDDFELLAAVDASILALKDDLEYYLEKAGEIKKGEGKEKKESVFSPLVSLYGGFKELLGLPQASKREGKKKAPKDEAGVAGGVVKAEAYLVYKLFKNLNKFFTE